MAALFLTTSPGQEQRSLLSRDTLYRFKAATRVSLHPANIDSLLIRTFALQGFKDPLS